MISFSYKKAYKPSLFFLVGDTIADGSALKTNYVDKYHGLTEKDLEKMSVKELEEHENEMAYPGLSRKPENWLILRFLFINMISKCFLQEWNRIKKF